MRSDSFVAAGISAGLRHELRIGLPPTNRHRQASRLPNSCCAANAALALPTAAAILRRLRIIPGFASSFACSAAEKTRHLRGIEPGESLAVRLALLQHRQPVQPGLRPFQNQEFEERPVVVNGDAPFAVVIFGEQRAGGPRAADSLRHVRLTCAAGRYRVVTQIGDDQATLLSSCTTRT